MRSSVIAIALLGLFVASAIATNSNTATGATGYISPRRHNIPSRFDYIVIGSGPGGSTVASRLSENPRNKVLLLERGSDTNNLEFLDVPRNWDKTHVSVADQFTMVDWRKETVVSWNEAKARASTGIGLGGTSLINSVMYVRGHPNDYDRWESEYGATGWSYNDVLPFFKKLETNPDKYSINPAYHGNSGPLHISQGTQVVANDQVLINAAAAYGIPFNTDHNGADHLTSPLGGLAFHDMTVFNGTRQSAYNSYIRPFLGRNNLWVVDSAHVTKINFQTKRGEITATSVDWYDALNNRMETSRASNEIILAAGGIHTPKLLQLSGVGDQEHLESLNIEVVKHLPGVGQNLMDHPITNLAVANTGLGDAPELVTSPEAYEEWKVNKTGVYSGIGGKMILYLRTKYQNASNDPRADVEVIGGTPGSQIFGAVYLALPKSRGYVKIHSANPFVEPLPVGNFFTDPRDTAALCEGLKMLYEIWQHVNPAVTISTGPSNFDDGFTCPYYITGYAPWTIGNSNTGSHWSGTARIGQASNPMAVVDHRLRVHGIANLRVADASVFPDIPSANTQATTYMVGEKAAAMILEDN